MGHHPPTGEQEIVQSSVSNALGGLSMASWIFILIVIALVAYLIYAYFKKK